MPPSQSEPSLALPLSAPAPSSYLAEPLALSHSHSHGHSASSPALNNCMDLDSDVPQKSASAPASPTHTPLPQCERRRETVVIFDWDDTLLASSFLSGRGYRLDSELIQGEVEAQLKELEQSVIACLQLAMQYGDVHVITNAETGWVQLSAQKFLPGVVPLLAQVKVMSARSTYEGMFPEAPLKWKYYAMHEKLSGLFGQLNTEKNIISFGDSHVEREAVRAVTRACPMTLCKSVKFAERPSMEQLRRQIELVTSCFSYIHNHEGDLDLQLTVTLNMK